MKSSVNLQRHGHTVVLTTLLNETFYVTYKDGTTLSEEDFEMAKKLSSFWTIVKKFKLTPYDE